MISICLFGNLRFFPLVSIAPSEVTLVKLKYPYLERVNIDAVGATCRTHWSSERLRSWMTCTP